MLVILYCCLFSQGHHGRTRAISRLPVSPSAGHGHTSSLHGSHTHLNGHAPKSEQESSSKRRPAAAGGGDSKSKGSDAHRINGQVKRSSLVMESVSTKFGRQASKDEGSRNNSSTTSSSDQASLSTSQKQTGKFFPKLL